jgi:TolB-like protein/cytochrome c-type biogenesis protein CcmH/NrfG
VEAPASLLSELKRRRVFRALVGYGIAAFAVLQIIEPIMHGLHWPEAVLSYVVAALALGFPIVVSLAWIFDVKEGRIERTAPAEGLRGRWLAPLLISIGILAATPGLYYYLVIRARRAPAATSASIAVLPLANLSGDPQQEYFADGLAEELLDLLAKVPNLHVAARTSAFSFKGKNDDARTIAEKLNVATLLEGSVRKSGDQIRITTQLIDARDGYHLWSETYDRKLTDVFAVQDEIARSVVAALRLQLLPQQEPTSNAHRTPNPEAYTQYLLGRHFFNQATLDGYRRAAQAYEKALAIDPTFAAAWAGLAHATYWIADGGMKTLEEIEEGQRLALERAEKAIALGPDLPEAYAARGAIRSATQWDWDGARADFQRALALSPENADVLAPYAVYVLRPLGRVEEGVTVAAKATRLDPLNGRVWTTLASFLVSAGRLDEARAAAERSLEVNPEQAFAPGWLGFILLLQGQPTAALQVSARSTNEVFRLMNETSDQHALGHGKESQAALDALIARHSHDGAYQIAAAYAWRGETDRAFEWLERSRKQRDGGLTLIQIDVMMRSLRNDPRYDAFLKELNLRRP